MTGPESMGPTSMPYPPGTVLAGKYRIERLLGEGGMGWVVVAMHLHLEQRVALKFMRSSHASDHPDAVARFIREARAAARVQSEHVARVSDVGTLENGAPYLVMEYLDGHDLDAELRKNRALPRAQMVDYALQACEGLAEAHAAGIVHRDLKPANLFLARKADGSVRVKLLDFGISKLAPIGGGASDAGMTSTQALMGSPLYMSPEQLRSSKNVDRRTDIWSMGVILYEMFAGSAPFQAETLPEVCARIMAEPPPPLRQLKPDVPAALESVVMRCLDKDVTRRFQDVGALAMALAPFGAPEARVAAERIGRLARSAQGSAPDLRPDASGPAQPMTAQAASGIAQTSASFGTVRPARSPRSPALPFAIGGGAVALVAIAVVGLIAVRGKHDAASAAGTAATSAPVATAPAATPTATDKTTESATPRIGALPPSSEAATASGAPTPTPPPSPAPPLPAHPAGPATATGLANQGKTAPRPKATTSAAPAPRPAGTNGFGGRD